MVIFFFYVYQNTFWLGAGLGVCLVVGSGGYSVFLSDVGPVFGSGAFSVVGSGAFSGGGLGACSGLVFFIGKISFLKSYQDFFLFH